MNDLCEEAHRIRPNFDHLSGTLDVPMHPFARAMEAGSSAPCRQTKQRQSNDMLRYVRLLSYPSSTHESSAGISAPFLFPDVGT